MKQLVQTFHISQHIDVVRSFYSDFLPFAEAHPLILSAQKIAPNPSKFKITERPFKQLPFKIRYIATIIKNKNEIDYIITKIPLTKLSIHYQLQSISPEQTKLQCTIQVKGYLIGKGILLKKMGTAQKEIIKSVSKSKNDQPLI